MKVLWFSVTPSLYSGINNEKEYINRGGWIASLEKIVTHYDDIELAIAFCDNNVSEDCKCIKQHGVNYYPIKSYRGFLKNIEDLYTLSNKDKYLLKKYKQIIEDFNPDVIQVFGSEWNFGLIYKITKKPIIIHIQGNWYSIRNCDFPPGYSLSSEILRNILHPFKCLSRLIYENISRKRAEREIDILRNHKYFFGRTNWDKSIVSLFAPKAIYIYCSEALRDEIISTSKHWEFSNKGTLTLCTVGAGQFIKGYDVIIKTIAILNKLGIFDIKWKLVGVDKKRVEYILKTQGQIDLMGFLYPLGKIGPEKLIDELINSDIYIHPSYIDNSSNAICEAQYLGLPIIATNTGGTVSLFDETYNRNMLVPVNDPLNLAYQIISLSSNKFELERLSSLNIQISHKRHEPSKIYKDLYEGYKQVIKYNSLSN